MHHIVSGMGMNARPASSVPAPHSIDDAGLMFVLIPNCAVQVLIIYLPFVWLSRTGTREKESRVLFGNSTSANSANVAMRSS